MVGTTMLMNPLRFHTQRIEILEVQYILLKIILEVQYIIKPLCTALVEESQRLFFFPGLVLLVLLLLFALILGNHGV